jgi:cytoskeletal protein RodZ
MAAKSRIRTWLIVISLVVAAGVGAVLAMQTSKDSSEIVASAQDDEGTIASSTSAVSSTSSTLSTTSSTTTSSTTASTTTSSTPEESQTSLSSVDWQRLTYPMDCGAQDDYAATPMIVQPQPDTEVAVVRVNCVAGAGTPPSAVFVYDSATSSTDAHRSQTLIDVMDNWVIVDAGLTSRGPTLSIAAQGYSRESVPRCCPDVDATLQWSWTDAGYKAVGTPPSHAELPYGDGR